MFKWSSMYNRISNKQELDKKSEEIANLIKENDRLRKHQLPDLDYDQGDKSPIDKIGRQRYAVDVRIAHEGWMKNKFQQMIVSCQKLLSDTGNSPELDMSLKGAIYFCNEMLLWGERMSVEAMSYDLGDKEENINN